MVWLSNALADRETSVEIIRSIDIEMARHLARAELAALGSRVDTGHASGMVQKAFLAGIMTMILKWDPAVARVEETAMKLALVDRARLWSIVEAIRARHGIAGEAFQPA